MTHDFEHFRARREAGNARVLDTENLATKRFFSLDKQVYGEGALSVQTKELLGLVASMVLRCNDCIDYHIVQCIETGWEDEALYEAFNVALVVGGSIVIPHLRHAVETVDLARAKHA